MVWGRNCHLCGKKGISKIDYNSRARVCPSCAHDTVVARSRLTEPVIHVDAFACIPSTTRFYQGVFEYREFFVPFFKTINDKLLELQEVGQTQVDEYRVEMVKLKRKREYDAVALQEWAQNARRAAESIKQDGREVRRQELERRFRALGDWTNKDFAGEWRQQSYVNDPKPLTERTWKNALPILEKWLTESRRARLESERRAEISGRQGLVRRYCKVLRSDTGDTTKITIPPMEVFMLLESVKGLWQVEEDWHALTYNELHVSIEAKKEEILEEIVEYNARSKLNLYRRCLDAEERWGEWAKAKLEDELCIADRARRAQCVVEGDADGIEREKEKARERVRLETEARALEVAEVIVVDVAESLHSSDGASDEEEEIEELEDDDDMPMDPAPAPPVVDTTLTPLVDTLPSLSPPPTLPTDVEMDELLFRQPALFKCAQNNQHCSILQTYSDLLRIQHTCDQQPTPPLSDDLYAVDTIALLAHSACVHAMQELPESTFEEKVKATAEFRLICVDCALTPRTWSPRHQFTYQGFMLHANHYCDRDHSLPFHAILRPTDAVE